MCICVGRMGGMGMYVNMSATALRIEVSNPP